MPIDSKRIAGPEATVPYQLFTEQKPWNQAFTESLTEAGLRLDGRKTTEHRKICTSSRISHIHIITMHFQF